jgi:crotonobetainyl-CoA:carnitine CoA-transferase CaiB-like acyl-CoA transferase
MQALDDIVVLDLSQHIAGPYATKLMADFGADVIKVEKPAVGDISRRFGPFAGGDAHPEMSGLFFFLNTNKRSVALDLKSDDGKAALRALAARADVVVSSFQPATAEALGITWDFFRAIKPGVSMVSITNFGQTGPYRDYRLTDLPLYAFAGEMYTMGLTHREPTKMAGTAALFESGAAAAPAILATMFAAALNGEGQHVDIALAETHFGGVDRRHATAIAYQFTGRKSLRAAGGAAGMPSGIYPCADGWVEFNNAALHTARVADMLDHAEWLSDPMFQDPQARVKPDVIEAWNANFIVWCLERTKREIWDEARRAKVMCGPLFSTQDLYEDEHFRGRGFWASADHPRMGLVEFPGRPFIMQEGGWELRRPAPLLGEHTAEVLRQAGVEQQRINRILSAGEEK